MTYCDCFDDEDDSDCDCPWCGMSDAQIEAAEYDHYLDVSGKDLKLSRPSERET